MIFGEGENEAACKCVWCGQPLRFDPKRGWVHPEGGGYVVSCEKCGWRGAPYPSPAACPRCGGEVKDDHCALPKMS